MEFAGYLAAFAGTTFWMLRDLFRMMTLPCSDATRGRLSRIRTKPVTACEPFQPHDFFLAQFYL
jgi:hypothetical protein